MEQADYEQQMLLHLCDSCDCTNAKFVWMRVPEGHKAALGQTQQVLQALSQN